MLKWLAIFLMCSIPRALTYSTGAPAEGCWSDRPLHSDYLPQGGGYHPFSVSTNATSYGPGKILTVTIASGTGLQHRGFLLRLVTSSGLRGGYWAVEPSIHRFNLECGVTHIDARPRDVTTVLWRAPAGYVGDLGNIQFKAIVVANLTHFWDNVLSPSLPSAFRYGETVSTLRRFQGMFSLLRPKSSRRRGPSQTSQSAPTTPASVSGQEATGGESRHPVPDTPEVNGTLASIKPPQGHDLTSSPSAAPPSPGVTEPLAPTPTLGLTPSIATTRSPV